MSTNARNSNHPRRRSTDQHAGERGIAVLLELIIVCCIMLILAAVALTNLVQIRASQNQAAARAQILQVARAQAALTLCNAAVPPLPCAGVQNLIPTATIVQQGYTFVYVGGANWNYTAAPTQPGISGIGSFFVDQTGVIRCGVNASAPAC